jgi:hypothetical protein
VRGIIRTKRFLVTVVSCVLLLGGAMPSASAQQQDGLVNVKVGDIVVRDVTIAVAASIAASACDLVDAQVVAIAQEVDQTGESQTVCRTESGKVKIRDN